MSRELHFAEKELSKKRNSGMKSQSKGKTLLPKGFKVSSKQFNIIAIRFISNTASDTGTD